MSETGLITCIYLVVIAIAGLIFLLWRRNNGGF